MFGPPLFSLTCRATSFLDHRSVPGLLLLRDGSNGSGLGLDIFLHLVEPLVELLVLLHQQLHLLFELLDLCVGRSRLSVLGVKQAEYARRGKGQDRFSRFVIFFVPSSVRVICKIFITTDNSTKPSNT